MILHVVPGLPGDPNPRPVDRESLGPPLGRGIADPGDDLGDQVGLPVVLGIRIGVRHEVEDGVT